MNYYFHLNGKPVVYAGTGTERLLDVVREGFDLTGTKCGCKEGECGACAVVVDGRLLNSCLVPVGSLQGRNVVTIEGFSEMPMFKEISKGFEDESAVQCGYCIPGMVLAAATLLEKNPDPTEDDIRTALSGNLCRCTGYNAIVRGVARAADYLGRDREPDDVFPRSHSEEDMKYVFPADLKTALEIRKDTDLRPCGGATDLLVGEPEEGSFFFIGQVPELKVIEDKGDHIRVGSGVTFTELLESDLIPQMVKDAASRIAAPAIRNGGTVGGNLGNGTAKADTVLTWFALDADIEVQSKDGGVRRIPILDFYHGIRDLDMKDDELITAVLIPKEDIGDYMYEKVGGRDALAISRISFGGVLTFDDEGKIDKFRAAFGAVAPTVLRYPEIEKKLIGLTKEEAREIMPQILEEYDDVMKFTRGRVSAEYRKKVCNNFLRTFLEEKLA